MVSTLPQSTFRSLTHIGAGLLLALAGVPSASGQSAPESKDMALLGINEALMARAKKVR